MTDPPGDVARKVIIRWPVLFILVLWCVLGYFTRV